MNIASNYIEMLRWVDSNQDKLEIKKYNLHHGVRLNGIVDVWKNGKTVYCLPINTYSDFDNFHRMVDYVKSCLVEHPSREPMKKLATGRMSYQEFKNNFRQK